MLLLVLFQVSIEINSELKVEFVLIFQSLSFFFVKISPIDINEEVLGLISDEGTFLLQTSVDLNLKVKFLI